MQVDSVEGGAVHCRLGRTKPEKQLFGALLARGSQRGAIDQPIDFGETAVDVMVAGFARVGVRGGSVIVGMAVRRVAVVVIVMRVVIVRVIVRMVRWRILSAHTEFRRANASTGDRFGPDGVGRDRQRAECTPDVVERYARIDERTEHHVAGRTGKAIEVEDPQIQTILSEAMQFSRFGKGVVALVGEDQMIEHVDADDLSRLSQPDGERHVVCARQRIA
jgi:hypothetical protein